MSRRSLQLLFKMIVISALVAAVFPSMATGDGTQQVPANAGAELWFVELSSPPAADGTNLSTLRQEKEAFRANAQRAGLNYTERRAFDTLWNGFSLSLTADELPKLYRIQGVKSVYPVEVLSLPESSEVPDMNTALQMTGADVAQTELGLTGAGVRVAIMDTGVDYHHPDLGGCFGPNCRVAAGHDFVGDAFNADSTSPSYNPVPVPDADPDDCSGHGTHVAGIVGASGTPPAGARGVAPGVTFGAYRVFGCGGSTTADIMIAAMERALADEMHVLNMSIGSAFQWPQYPTALASNRLVNRGMVVVASIGNSGASGLYSAGAPGLGEKVIGVASFDNSHVILNTFTITPDNTAIGYGPASAAPPPPTSGSLPMARTGTPTSTADACNQNPLPAGSLTGKAVLIRRGTCTFHEKALNAQNAGAAAVVLYNNSAGRFSATVAGSPAITIPVVSVSNTDGVLINSRLNDGPVTLTWTEDQGTFTNATGGLISSFSSYGLSPDLTLKPDIGGPGGLIRSTYLLENGGYATLSGTSMSSPHVAGGVALLLEAKPNTPAQAVRSILQNTASPKNWWGNPNLGFLDNVHRQGAGMVQIDRAILSTTKVEPGKLSLGESESGPVTRTLTLENNSGSDVTYTLSHTPALSTGPNTFSPSFSTSFATAAFSAPEVVVPAGGTATVDVTITANSALANKSIYGGYIVLTPQGAGQVYRVPYAGLKGDYQSIQVLTPTSNGFPWLARRTGSNYFNRPAGETYTLAGGDVPYILVHLDHQVRRLRMNVVDTSGRSWHRAMDLEYSGRNSTSTGFFALAWDGTTQGSNRIYTVPNGTYVVRLSVLKALGDSENPAHWETWNSPPITINRP